MRRMIRTLIAAAVATFVTVPAFAQAAPQPGKPAARQHRLTPEQRRTMRRGPAARRAARMRRTFKRLDRDGNGAISRQEWQRRPELFDRLDANKDGQLTREELRRARRRRPNGQR